MNTVDISDDIKYIHHISTIYPPYIHLRFFPPTSTLTSIPFLPTEKLTSQSFRGEELTHSYVCRGEFEFFGAADVFGSEDSQVFGKNITPGTVGVVHAVAMFWSGLQILQVPGLVCKKQRVVVVFLEYRTSLL